MQRRLNQHVYRANKHLPKTKGQSVVWPGDLIKSINRTGRQAAWKSDHNMLIFKAFWSWLGTQDSNLDLRSQSPLSYH